MRSSYLCGSSVPSNVTGQRSTAWHALRALRAWLARARGATFLLRALFQGSSEVGGIKIYGRQVFREQVAAALRLLHAGAPAAFSLCEQYFDLVIMSRHSGVHVATRPGIVMLGEWAIEASARYLASGLAHEAFHCSLYWSYRDRHPGRDAPTDVFSGERAERECLEYQISVLRQLGETEESAAHLRDLMKTEWWNVPWHERTW